MSRAVSPYPMPCRAQLGSQTRNSNDPQVPWHSKKNVFIQELNGSAELDCAHTYEDSGFKSCQSPISEILFSIVLIADSCLLFTLEVQVMASFSSVFASDVAATRKVFFTDA